MKYKSVVEGLLFVVGDEGITIEDIAKTLDISIEEVKNILVELRKDYESPDRGIRITFLGNTFKLTTKKEHTKYYEKLFNDNREVSLSNACLETLAIIAYNEPITRIKIDEIRGIGSAHLVRRLHAMGFIKECGKEDSIGKPILYKTTSEFLDYFGLATKADLPKLPAQEKPQENLDKDLYTTAYKE